MFKKCPALRDLSHIELGRVLTDIESHMPAGHIYRDNDKITWGHETTHGINARVRNDYNSRMQKRVNAFYVLDDNVAIIEEPKTTIREVAAKVPESLRGSVYNLYLIEQTKSWNDTPLYILDEWTAYTNGSAVRLNLDIESRSETVLHMLEFIVYSICVGMFTDNIDLKHYLTWGTVRAMRLYRFSKMALGDSDRQTKYLKAIRTSTDAAGFREFCRVYFNFEWAESILGF